MSSASERLRALDGVLPQSPLRLIGGWPALEELRAALPLIADGWAEVEAFLKSCEDDAGEYWPPTNARDDDVARLYRADLALKEALE